MYSTVKRRTFLFATVTVLVIVVSFLSLEAGYRLYKLYQYGMVDYPDVVSLGIFQRDKLYGTLPTPNFRSDQIPDQVRFHPNVKGFEKLFTFNRLGYRGKDFSIEKPPDTFRIVTFGGSTTMDLESADPDTWPALLEKKLDEDTRFKSKVGANHIEVINAGLGGSRTREGLLRLQNEVQHFAPDLILVAYNWNDVWRGLNGEDPNMPSSPETPWWYYSKLLQNVRIRYMQYQAHNDTLYRTYISQLRRDSSWGKAYISNLLEMKRIASQIGARMILVNLPGLCRKESRDSSEFALIVKNTRVTPESFDYWVEHKAFVTALFNDLNREYGIEVIDVAASFQRFAGAQRVELFTDEVHFSDAGAREVAAAIYQALALGLSRP